MLIIFPREMLLWSFEHLGRGPTLCLWVYSDHLHRRCLKLVDVILLERCVYWVLQTDRWRKEELHLEVWETGSEQYFTTYRQWNDKFLVKTRVLFQVQENACRLLKFWKCPKLQQLFLELFTTLGACLAVARISTRLVFCVPRVNPCSMVPLEFVKYLPIFRNHFQSFQTAACPRGSIRITSFVLSWDPGGGLSDFFSPIYETLLWIRTWTLRSQVLWGYTT